MTNYVVVYQLGARLNEVDSQKKKKKKKKKKEEEEV